MKMKLENSFPVILSNNAPDEVWSFFDALPKDYKKFLDNTNGGFAEEFKYTFETGVPYITEKVNNPSKTDCVIEFFGICTSQTEREKFPKDLIETAKEYVAEEFLPLGIIAIASCIQNSLVCVSLRKNDFGQIFYWDWYWKYPWSKEFFQSRIDKVSAAYPNAEEVLSNPQNDLYQIVLDEFNYATIVKIADSFDDFSSKLKDVREKDISDSP
jgi:hypothetical protein